MYWFCWVFSKGKCNTIETWLSSKHQWFILFSWYRRNGSLFPLMFRFKYVIVIFVSSKCICGSGRGTWSSCWDAAGDAGVARPSSLWRSAAANEEGWGRPPALLFLTGSERKRRKPAHQRGCLWASHHAYVREKFTRVTWQRL